MSCSSHYKLPDEFRGLTWEDKESEESEVNQDERDEEERSGHRLAHQLQRCLDHEARADSRLLEHLAKLLSQYIIVDLIKEIDWSPAALVDSISPSASNKESPHRASAP